MTCYIRIGDELFNFAQLVHIDTQHKDTHNKTYGRSGVLLTLPDGSVRYYWDDQAERLRDFLEGRNAELFPTLTYGPDMRIVTVVPAEAQPATA